MADWADIRVQPDGRTHGHQGEPRRAAGVAIGLDAARSILVLRIDPLPDRSGMHAREIMSDTWACMREIEFASHLPHQSAAALAGAAGVSSGGSNSGVVVP